MCYDTDAAPPVFGTPATSVVEARESLTTAGGTRITSFLAVPDDRTGAAVLVLPDNGGLSGFYEQLATRFAEQGHLALAVDYVDRANPAPAGDEIPFAVRFLRFCDRVLDDVLPAALARLRAAGEPAPLVALGCCLGGRLAFLAGTRPFGLAGAVGLYGGPQAFGDAPGPTQLAGEMTAPVLGLFGGADESISADDVRAFEEALSAAGVAHEIVTYPGAPHGFFDKHMAGHTAASADAWRRVLAFLAANAAGS
ncbi:MAG TPA: dienelactone hydrolase family protein [Streptosporangiales bacterium]